jgi:dihydrofolate reductase
MITVLVAFDESYNIGKDNSIPWHFPKDLANFKRLTTGNVCIMGRKTWESLPNKFRPLPDRVNIVISKTYHADPDKFMKSFGNKPENTFTVKDTEEAVLAYENMFADKECYIIGGSQVYNECFEKDLVDRMIITHINGKYDGDVKFPNINWNNWISNKLEQDENFTIIQYDKK